MLYINWIAYKFYAVVIYCIIYSIPMLYKSMVRPHLEYGNMIWGHFYMQDIKAVEAIQCRATKLVSHLKNEPYEERLKILKLPSLVFRRKHGDPDV